MSDTDMFVVDSTEKKPKKKAIKIVYSEMTSGEICKLVKVTGRFKNKLELCKLVEKQGAVVVYPDALLKNK